MNGFTITTPGGVEYTVIAEGEASALLGQLYASKLPVGLHEDIAQAAGDVFRKHLKNRDHTHPNKLGGRRSHFYWHAAEAVENEATTEGAKVSIDYLGLRQRWLGGDICPVNAKMLAIPARSESYGVAPRDFPGDLIPIRFKSGAVALVKDEQTHTVDSFGGERMRSAAKGQRKSRKRGIGLVEYWLVDHVHQNPDPSVMPSVEQVLDAVTKAAGDYLQNQ